MLKRLARAGHAVVVVTHHLDEVLAHSDRVSVIRHGRLIGSAPTASLDKDQLVQQIVGRAVALEGGCPAGQRRSEARNCGSSPCAVRGTAFSSGLRGISLSLRAGEVVGIAGVEGNGQRELFEILSGLRQPDRGTVHIADRSAMVGLVPEDRHTEGLVLDLPVSLNLVLDRLDQAPFSRYGRLRHGAIAARARDLARTYDVRAASLDHPARLLSGGNQQKLIIGRALSADARVLVVYQPTRGLDVAASEDVLARIRAAANAGLAVIADLQQSPGDDPHQRPGARALRRRHRGRGRRRAGRHREHRPLDGRRRPSGRGGPGRGRVSADVGRKRP